MPKLVRVEFKKTSSGSDTIYVQLMNEGVTTYRPAPAVLLSEDPARLLMHPDYDPRDEEWEFQPGSLVRTERKVLSGGEVTVAVELIDDE